MYWDAEPAAWLVLQSVHRGVQVCCTSTTSPHQVSVLKSLAEMFDLKAFADVVVYGPIEPEDAAVTFVELHFKDQFISRGDMWLFTEAMMNLPVHRKKTFDLLGMRVSTRRWLPTRLVYRNLRATPFFQARIEDIKRSKVPVDSGVLTKRTKVIFRSRSARIFWLVQMSSEMWQPCEVCP